MYGVGENPVYAKRVKDRLKRNRAKGKADNKDEEKRRASLIGTLFDEDVGVLEAFTEEQAPLGVFGEAVIPSNAVPQGTARLSTTTAVDAISPMDESTPLTEATTSGKHIGGGLSTCVSMQEQQVTAASDRTPQRTDEGIVWSSLFAEEEAWGMEESLNDKEELDVVRGMSPLNSGQEAGEQNDSSGM